MEEGLAEGRAGGAVDPLARLAAPPIFIVGQFRSGTTWVYDMLTAHREVAGAFESWLFTGDMGLANLFHPAHFAHDVPLFGSDYRLGRLISRERLIDDVRQLAAAWLAEALKPGHRYLVEKTPNHWESIPVIEALFPEARFVHVLRDGRDVAVSALAAASTWGQGYVSPSVRVHAGHWTHAVSTVRAQAASLGPRFLEVRYEELSMAPVETARRLFEFCSIPCDEQRLTEIVEEVNFTRHNRLGQGAFRRRGQVGEWRSALTWRECLDFVRGSGSMLVEAGYENTKWWWLLTPPRALRPRRTA